MLHGRPHPQHRHGRRRAGEPLARPDGDPPGRHPFQAHQALSRRRPEPGAAGRHDDQRPQARPQRRRPEGLRRRHEHRRAQGARADRQVRPRHAAPGHERPFGLCRAPGARDPALDPGRRVFLLRLCRRGRPGRLPGAAGGDAAHRGQFRHPRLHRQRPAAHLVAQRADRRQSASHADAGRRLLHPLFAQSQPGAEFRPDAAVPLHPARGNGGQSAVPRRGRHAQPDLRTHPQPAVRRLRPGHARAHAGGTRGLELDRQCDDS